MSRLTSHGALPHPGCHSLSLHRPSLALLASLSKGFRYVQLHLYVPAAGRSGLAGPPTLAPTHRCKQQPPNGTQALTDRHPCSCSSSSTWQLAVGSQSGSTGSQQQHLHLHLHLSAPEPSADPTPTPASAIPDGLGLDLIAPPNRADSLLPSPNFSRPRPATSHLDHRAAPRPPPPSPRFMTPLFIYINRDGRRFICPPSLQLLLQPTPCNTSLHALPNVIGNLSLAGAQPISHSPAIHSPFAPSSPSHLVACPAARTHRDDPYFPSTHYMNGAASHLNVREI